MTDDEIEFSLDVLREYTVNAFNRGNRRKAKRLGFVFHALLRERERRTINVGRGAPRPEDSSPCGQPTPYKLA